MAAPPNPAPGAVAALSEKEAFGKLQPASREPPGAASAKKVRTEERKAPRRVNGDGGSGSGRQPASYGGPAAWSFAPAAAASSSPAAARSCFSPPASAAPAPPPPQPLPRTLLLAPSLLHSRPQHVLLPPAAPPSSSSAAAAAAKPRRPKDRREREKRRHGLGGAARDENGEARPSLQPPPPPRGGCRRGRGAAGARAGAREGGWRRLPVRAPRDVHGAGGLPAWAQSARDRKESGL